MSDADRLRDELGAVMAGAGTGLAAADRLCRACVDLLEVDGAAISLVHEGASRGTFGSSSALSRRLDSHQFTTGEGPCLDAVRSSAPVLVPDITDAAEQRWPAFAALLGDAGVRAVFALPVLVASTTVGALDLFRRAPGPLGPLALGGGALAAHLAALPLLDLMTQAARRAEAGLEEGDQDEPWSELESLERVEIYQATGMLIAQGGIGPADALVRLRARAFSTGRTASEVAWDVIERRSALAEDGSWAVPGGAHGPGDQWRPGGDRG